MLEVGAGTGRFATFVRDNYPHATLTISDLSPFYLQTAFDSMRYWEGKMQTATRKGTCRALPRRAAGLG